MNIKINNNKLKLILKLNLKNKACILFLTCTLFINLNLFNALKSEASYIKDASKLNFLTIATGGEAGVYYPLGRGIAKLLTGYLDNIIVKAESSDASIANIEMIEKREVSLAIVQNDTAFRAVNGAKPFKKPVQNLNMIASLYPEQVQCIAIRNKANNIKALNKAIKGKRVSVGLPGSEAAENVSIILSIAGMKYADLKAEFLDFTESIERLYDGQLDVGFVFSGYPTAAVTALAERKDIDIVQFDEELLDKLIIQYPFFTKDIIPADTYKGVNYDVQTVAVTATLVCDSNMPDDLVYEITKTLFENLSELDSAHSKAKFIELNKALDQAAIKIHPGAVKYYTEKGLAIPILFEN